MGYRSDVAYIILFKSEQDRNRFITLERAKNDEHINNALDEVTADDKERPVITFKAYSVKWYPEFEDVRAHQTLYNEAFTLFNASYRFVALGEDGQEDFRTDGPDEDDLYDDVYSAHNLYTSF